MKFDYFTGRQAEQFAFYQIPKILIVDERFDQLSLDAKLLYALMLDRAALSSKNGWLDDKGRVYIIYTLEQVMADLHCANQKVSRMMKELEKIGLIERKRQGQGKPTLIYVKDFTTGLDEEHPKPSQVQTHENHESEIDNSEKAGISQVLNHENHESEVVKIMSPESWKSHTNNTDNNKTEINETKSINQSALPQPSSGSMHTVSDGYDLMKKTEKAMDPAEIGQLAEKLKGAGIVYLYGFSLSMLPAQFMCDVLKHNQIRSFCLSYADFYSSDSLFTEDDIVVDFSVHHNSFHGEIEKINSLRHKPETILITMTRTHPLRGMFDQVITLPASPDLMGEELVMCEHLTYMMFVDLLSNALEKA